ncbi:aspartyl/asparaginyl beta-hydroxylase isoform X4 [Acipenser ruthenus]|uniref:aspartyl/asparaginyl beta-hydroxylase isoform X4 n=1 Tax=Acipenser ruthenus TaxID=7906 RepID=UPI002741E198|nr:aspartyl/asparaginyl beta-hydroxylase isoform X4 [Acipenser ruthenus]
MQEDTMRGQKKHKPVHFPSTSCNTNIAFPVRTLTDGKPVGNKNGKKGEGLMGSSFFTWFMIITLLGVWTSVAVVWFDLVDYEDVLARAKDFHYNISEVLQGKLGVYDADGDGDFDVEDAKVLLGLKERPIPLDSTSAGGAEETVQPLEDEVEEAIFANVAQKNAQPPEESVEQELAPEEELLEEDQIPFQEAEEEEEAPYEELQEEEMERPVEAAEEVIPLVEEQEEEKEVEVETLAAPLEEAAPTEEESVEEEKVEVAPLEEEKNELEEAPSEEEKAEEETEAPLEEEIEEATLLEDARIEEEEQEDDVSASVEEQYEEIEAQIGEADAEEEQTEEAAPVEETAFAEDPVEEATGEEVAPEPEEEALEQEEYAAEDSEGQEYYEQEIQDSDPDPEDEVYGSQSTDVESEIQAAVPLPEPVYDDWDTEEETTEAAVDAVPEKEQLVETKPEYVEEPQEEDAAGVPEPEEAVKAEQTEEEADQMEIKEKKKTKEKAKKMKPKLLNKFDKTIKAEIDAAEKLRKKGKVEDAMRAFEDLVSKYPESPRARYGKAQTEDDLAEKQRSNEALQRAIKTYGEVAEVPNAPTDLVKLTLRRRAERQQFLGRLRGALVTLEKLVQLFPDDVSLKNDLGVGYLLLGDNEHAKRVYEEVLSVAPDDGFAKVHYGFILKSENMMAESIPYLKEGLESGDPGTDDGRFYFHLGDALQRVGDKDAYKWYEIGHQRGHFASVWQRSLYNVDKLKAQAWWTAKETGYTDLVKALERNWKTIRDEALGVMDTERGLFIPEDENLREKGEWGQFTLWQQGKKNENSCRGVPKTCALLERFSEATGCKRGQIKYSVMQPGTHIWPHTGPTNCRLRMHLGLVIPSKGCWIRCANDTRSWEEGKVLIFDDSFEHEVWQDADSYRLIFIVDVWHPELTPHQRRTLSPI